MPDVKMTDLASLSIADFLDLLEVVDVSDTSMAVTGTNKKITLGALLDAVDHLRALPSTIRPIISAVPKTGGKFMDFRFGAEGVTLLPIDPPSPDWFDTVAAPAGSTFVYSKTQLLAPIPMMIKITTSGAALGCNAGWIDDTYPPLTTHYGRFYLYLDTLPSANIRLCRWGQNSIPQAQAYLRLNSGTNKLDILDNASAVKASSTYALSAGQHYRFEWQIVYGTSGTIRVKTFIGHSTTPVDDFTATFNNGDFAVAVTYGNINNVDLGGNIFRIGAIAGACLDWPGPYNGQPDVFTIPGINDKNLIEITNDGEIVVRAGQDYYQGDGARYMVQRGDVVARINGTGIFFGPNGDLYNPAISNADVLKDFTLEGKSRRAAVGSLNVIIANDPPDIAFNRISSASSPNNANYGEAGSNATWAAGSPTVTFGDFALSMFHRGHRLLLGGTLGGTDGEAVNIAEILSPTQCTVKPLPTTSGTGSVWKIVTAPYPNRDYAGIADGGIAGQLRWSPWAFAPIRSSTAGTLLTSDGSAVVTVSGFDSNDVGRHLLINSDPTLSPVGLYEIISVVGTSVTLNGGVPALVNVPWVLVGGVRDGNAQQALATIISLAATTTKVIANTDPSHVVLGGRIVISAPDPSILQNAGALVVRTIMIADADGSLLAGVGPLGYATAQGAGSLVTQLTSKTTPVTINKATGKITMHNQSMTAGQILTFTVNNSLVKVDDVIVVNIRQGAAASNSYRTQVAAVTTGSFNIQVTNISAGPLSEALVLNFAIIKGSAS